MPVQFSNFVTKPPLLASEWPPAQDWRANNNTLGDWDKCFEQPPAEIPQHLAATFDNSSLKMLTAQEPADKMHSVAGYSSPKEDGRKSSEHTNSYDVSASQSPSNDGAQSDSTADEQIDVECMIQTEEMEVDDKEDTMEAPVEVETPVPVLPAPIALAPGVNGDQPRLPVSSFEETQLLLQLTQNQFSEVIAEAAKIRKSSSESIGFIRSGTSAFSNIEPKETSSVGSEPPAPTVSTSTNSSTPSSASFCRAPGLGPVVVPASTNGQLVCAKCGFMCPSKFHFNSHMNTHGDHQCSMCDYTSRTEGRLKKHMRESHTIEEQLRAGLELDPPKDSNYNATSPKVSSASSSSSKDSSAGSPFSESFNLSTTMASLLDTTNNVIAAIAPTDFPPSLPTSLNLDMSSTPNLLSTLAQGGSINSSALEQIKAFAENTNLLPEGGMSLASALGVVSQAIKGEPGSPEKQSSSENRRSSTGKMKVLKCKQCGHNSLSKNEQWAHARTHIPMEKQLNCQNCNFVTEYKHHLEYHYRNHIGSKPFQCKKCIYSCVNKSMLNSHMKSHTNHYQFRCMDCTYATKYCHSLKLHLKKYNHRRVPEGIEVTGGETSPTLSSNDGSVRLSPKMVKQEMKTEPAEAVTSIPQPFAFNPMVANQGLNFANQMLLSVPGMRPTFKCAVCDFVCHSQDEHMRHNMSHILNSTNVPTTIASLYNSLNFPSFGRIKIESDEKGPEDIEVDAKPEEHINEDNANEEEIMDHSSDLTVSPAGSSQASSADDKCKPLNLDHINQNVGCNSSMSPDSAVVRDEESTEFVPQSPMDSTSVTSPPHQPMTIATPVALAPKTEPNILQALLQQAQANIMFNIANRANTLMCQHCNIPFASHAIYAAHMATHSLDMPFKCSKCEYQANDSLSFALHMFQAQHQ
uniref:C2H2-type domain-containing protein n=1 Tax=Caenorhabditis japonica TaxID=281687 RepID=A0A8R1HM54_CAEJA